MKAFHCGILVLAFACLGGRLGAAETAAGAWSATTWDGERAFTSVDEAWRAVVSVERARLVYFGSIDGGNNLLFVAVGPNNPAGWGGHRLWLGPQAEWPGGWPPPKAWEASAAASVKMAGDRLQLILADAGDGWPKLSREYFWKDHRLHCGACTSGGTRPAQMIHILQVPPDAVVEVAPIVSEPAPRGYVQLHLGRQPSPQGKFPPPPHVTEAGEKLQLRFLNRTEKLGFMPQTLVARIGSTTLRVSRGECEGTVAGVPDDGFATQVYLGSGASQLIELEQLSPRWTTGGDAQFEVVLEAAEEK